MRRYFIICLLLLLSYIARGQAVCYYWTDSDTRIDSCLITDGTARLQLDALSLPTGLHCLYLQAKDYAGILGSIYCKNFFFYQYPKAASFRYWMDGTLMESVPIGDGKYMLDVSMLPSGLHLMNYCLVDARGDTHSHGMRGFYRTEMPATKRLLYWFNSDTVLTESPAVDRDFQIDVSHLSEGYNTLHLQWMENDMAQRCETYMFIKVPTMVDSSLLTLRCFIDQRPYQTLSVAHQGGVIHSEIDVQSLPLGIHQAQFQVVTADSTLVATAETYFLRVLTEEEMSRMTCLYTIDNCLTFRHTVTSGNGWYHMELPVDSLENGLHYLNIALQTEKGDLSGRYSTCFFKQPLGGKGISRYDYWLNDLSDSITTVEIAEPQDTTHLLTMLPVAPQPIRSSCFRFAIPDSVACVYALNDIHLRLYNTAGRWTEIERQYMDPTVCDTVVPVDTLLGESGSRQFGGLRTDSIQWYVVDCRSGDSLALRVSQAATLQVFSPTAQQLYDVSGTGATAFGGFRTTETGTYYIAVHDVEGGSRTTTLYYYHESVQYLIEATADHGTVEGSGIYTYGDSVTLLAIPDEEYVFEQWSNGVTDNPYIFVATEDVQIYAVIRSIHSTAVQQVEDERHIIKYIDRSGHLVIECNGVRYDAIGQQL